MNIVDTAGVRYFQFESFPGDLTQAIFTRRGGVSPAPWDTLNVGGTVGDESSRVRENRLRSFAAVGRKLDSMYDVWQVHSADVVMADQPRRIDQEHRKADIIVTDRPGVTLYMRFADCVPIMLFDPVRSVVAMAHAGWLGTVRGASKAAVEAMSAGYGSNPADIIAAIGPSIGPDHYEVGADVLAQVRDAFGGETDKLVEERGGRTFFDLWAANRVQLHQAGIERIEVAGVCTACHTEDWFSHRAEYGKTGRFGALLALPE